MNTRTRFGITSVIAIGLLFCVEIIDPVFLRGSRVWYTAACIGAWISAVIIFKMLDEMITDAWAYLTNPEARQLSPFTYPGGAGMSVRVAKQRGLM